MTKPAWKAEGVSKALDGMAQALYGRMRSESIQEDICLRCNQPAVEFTDDLSRSEYRISGLCQQCQDEIFNEMEKI